MTVFAFGVPLITLLSTYGMIFASIRRHTKRVSHWRTSTNGSNGKRDSPRVTDITGREFESFLSNSGVEEEKSNFKRVKEACTDHSVPDNSIGDLRAHVCEAESIKAKVSERHHDKKFRSHSAGCQHTRTDENLLPLFVQMKSAAKAITSDESRMSRLDPGPARSACSFPSTDWYQGQCLRFSVQQITRRIRDN